MDIQARGLHLQSQLRGSAPSGGVPTPIVPKPAPQPGAITVTPGGQVPPLKTDVPGLPAPKQATQPGPGLVPETKAYASPLALLVSAGTMAVSAGSTVLKKLWPFMVLAALPQVAAASVPKTLSSEPCQTLTELVTRLREGGADTVYVAGNPDDRADNGWVLNEVVRGGMTGGVELYIQLDGIPKNREKFEKDFQEKAPGVTGAILERHFGQPSTAPGTDKTLRRPTGTLRDALAEPDVTIKPLFTPFMHEGLPEVIQQPGFKIVSTKLPHLLCAAAGTGLRLHCPQGDFVNVDDNMNAHWDDNYSKNWEGLSRTRQAGKQAAVVIPGALSEDPGVILRTIAEKLNSLGHFVNTHSSKDWMPEIPYLLPEHLGQYCKDNGYTIEPFTAMPAGKGTGSKHYDVIVTSGLTEVLKSAVGSTRDDGMDTQPSTVPKPADPVKPSPGPKDEV